MTRIKLTIAVLAWLCLAAPAQAVGAFSSCADPLNMPTTDEITVGAGFDVTAGSRFCYQFDADTDSAVFPISAQNALICFDPDAAGVAGAARLDVEMCPYALNGGASAANACITILDAALSGAGGAAATQNACIRVKSGYYRLDPTVAPGSGAEKAIVIMTGER